MWMKILQYGLGALDKFLGNARDKELRADGARKGELASRDAQDKVRQDAKNHRKIDNSATDNDVVVRLRRNKSKNRN